MRRIDCRCRRSRHRSGVGHALRGCWQRLVARRSTVWSHQSPRTDCVAVMFPSPPRSASPYVCRGAGTSSPWQSGSRRLTRRSCGLGLDRRSSRRAPLTWAVGPIGVDRCVLREADIYRRRGSAGTWGCCRDLGEQTELRCASRRSLPAPFFRHSRFADQPCGEEREARH